LSLCHELSTTSMFSLSLHDALPIFEAFAVWSTYSTETVIFTLPRSINLLASVRNASSRSDTTLGKRKLSSKNLELRDFNSTVYLTKPFSCYLYRTLSSILSYFYAAFLFLLLIFSLIISKIIGRIDKKIISNTTVEKLSRISGILPKK